MSKPHRSRPPFVTSRRLCQVQFLRCQVSLSLTGAARCVYRGIEFINLGSFQIGCILLSGLFFYDVFWVFLSKPLIGSNVMVTVAKSFKGPIKFLFKKPGCDVRYKLHRSSSPQIDLLA